MSNIIVIEDGNIIQDMNHNTLWDGLFSIASRNGSIVRFIIENAPKNTIIVIPHSDGNLKRIHLDNEKYDMQWSEIQSYIDYAKSKNKIFILGILGQTIVQEPDINYLYLPLDDEFFEKGVEHFFPQDKLIPWDQRSNDLCWRGGCSGSQNNNSLRVRFVNKLYNYPHAENVRLSHWWSANKYIPSHLFAAQDADRIHYTEFLKYKMFFIIDGNVIASNHMWGFASGCVPFLISNGICWFQELIEPYVHYIPVNHDLSNLIEQIEYIKNNDDVARNIAENALAFTRIYFSSDFQKEYLRNKMYSFISLN
jgi:hypothetical protein